MRDSGIEQAVSHLRERAGGLAWSLWSELGVSSWEARRHQDWAIELEPLLVLTARVGRDDRRLWSEALDWCATNERFISATQLRRVLAVRTWGFQEDLHLFGGALSRVTKLRWPGTDPTTEPLPTLSGKSGRPDLSRPSLLSLRLRAIFGVSARAEILRTLLLTAGSQSIRSIADRVAYTRRQIELDLDLLTASGVVFRDDTTSPATYELWAPDRLVTFVGTQPLVAPRWASLVHCLTGTLDAYESVASARLAAPEVELGRRTRDLEGTAREARLHALPPSGSLEELTSWATELADALAAGDEGIFRRSGPGPAVSPGTTR